MNNHRVERQPHVVLVPGSFQGHISPMLELGNVLHSKGFSIIIAHTVFNAPNPCNHPEFTFIPIHDNLSDAKSVPENLIDLVTTININCEEPFRRSLARIMNHQEPHDQICCIIYDMINYFAAIVANDLKLPCMILRTSGATPGVAYDSLAQLHEQGLYPAEESKLQDLVPGHHPLRFMDISTSDMGNLKEVLEISAITADTRTSSAMIWNSVDHLEGKALKRYRQKYPIPCFAVGPMHKMVQMSSSTSIFETDNNCVTWLDKQATKSVIYVSIGSLAVMSQKELAEIAWGLANCGQPFLWVIRPGSVYNSEWIELLPDHFQERVGERGYIVKWAPQREVLAHDAVGGFWSHCGWNSLLESISEGVPMICRPCFADQNINARYLCEVWMVGFPLEQVLERGAIARAIKRLIVDNEGDEIRRNATDMKERITISVSKGGSSYNSLNDLTELILSFGSVKVV